MKPSKKIRELVATAGLEIVDCGLTGKSHIKATLRRSDGQCVKWIFPLTPSDFRWAFKSLSDMRRFARGEFNPIMARA